MIKREITVNVTPTARELAFVFCNNDSQFQAEFFNEIAVLTDKWKKPFCFQLEFIRQNKTLTDDGRHIMEAIGDYGKAEL